MINNKSTLHDAISHEIENNILCIKLPKSRKSVSIHTRNFQNAPSNSIDRACIDKYGQKCRDGAGQVHVVMNKSPPVKTPEQEALLIRTKQETTDNNEHKHTLEIHFKAPRNYVPLPSLGPCPQAIIPKPFKRKQHSMKEELSEKPYLECECIENTLTGDQHYMLCMCDKITSKSRFTSDRKSESSKGGLRARGQAKSTDDDVQLESQLGISKDQSKLKNQLELLKDENISRKQSKVVRDEAKLRRQSRIVEDDGKSKKQLLILKHEDKSRSRPEYMDNDLSTEHRSQSARNYRKGKFRLDSARGELKIKRRAESAREDFKAKSRANDLKEGFRIKHKQDEDEFMTRKPKINSYLDCIGHYKNNEKQKWRY